MQPLQAECRLQIGNDHHAIEKPGDDGVHGSSGSDRIRRPTEGTLRKLRRPWAGHREKVAGKHGSTALNGLAECLQGLLGHVGVLENNGSAGGSQGGLNCRNLCCRNLDQGGQRADDAGLKKLRAV